jgi:hypothetical protein
MMFNSPIWLTSTVNVLSNDDFLPVLSNVLREQVVQQVERQYLHQRQVC